MTTPLREYEIPLKNKPLRLKEKNILVFLCLIFITTSLHGQRRARQGNWFGNKDDFKIGVGYQNISYYDLGTFQINAEYSKAFIDPLIIGFSIDYGFGDTDLDVPEISTTVHTFSINLTGNIALVKEKKHDLRLGGGVSARYLSKDKDILPPSESSALLEPGFIAQGIYSFMINERWFLGIKGGFQYYNRDSNVFFGLLHLGIKL